MEIWKPIPGYEGLYEASDQGRVRSLDRSIYNVEGSRQLNGKTVGIPTYERRFRGTILKQAPHTDGRHRVVYLSKNGKSKPRLVHVLILETFIGLCPPGMETRHLNDIADDNRIENLVWGTRSDNIFDRRRNGNSLNKWNSSKTHCPHGHEYTVENTYRNVRTGSRGCKICRRLRVKEYRQRKKSG